MRLIRRPLATDFRTPFRTDGHGGRWQNEKTGRGGPMDRHGDTGYGLPAPLDQVTIDALQEYNAIGRRIIWREPLDALRPGFRMTWDGVEATEERRVYKWLRTRYDLISTVRLARAFARGTGGAGIVIVGDDGRNPDEPLDLANLRCVHRLVVRDRFEIWPDPQIDLDPFSPWFGTSKHYIVNGVSRTFRVHASRVIRFDGLPLADRSRQLRNGWGGSYFDLIYAELRDYGASHADAAEAITLLTQGVFKMKGFSEAASAKNDKKIMRRYRAMRMGMGTLGDIVIDAENESYETQSRSFAGLAELLAMLRDALIAASEMPEVLLRGNRSAGLNGGSEGDDVRGWFDFVGAGRSDHYEKPITQLSVVLLSQPDSPTNGLVPAAFGLDEWPPMWTPTAMQAAEIRNKNSGSRANDIAAQVIDKHTAQTDPELAEIYTMPLLGPAPPDRGSLEPDAATNELVIQDEAQIPEGETPLSATAAAAKMGFSSAGPVLGMIQRSEIRVWRASKGSPYRVLLSEVAGAMVVRPVASPL